MSEQKSDLVSRGAFWKHTTQNGKPYLSGQIKEDDGTIRDCLIFPNNKKENPKAPDYRLVEKVKHTEQPETDGGDYGPDAGDNPEIPF